MKKNNNRKHILRIISFVISMLVSVLLLSNQFEGNVLAKNNRREKTVSKLVNIERTKRGLTALSSFSNLENAVDKRAKELIETFDHIRPDGSNCFSIIDEFGIDYMSCAENIAVGQTSAKQVVAGWMNSEGHRKNILSNKSIHLSNGYVKGGKYQHNWAQLFIGGCDIEKLKIKDDKKIIRIKKGEQISSLNLTLNVRCDMHGLSHVKIINQMCTGYHSNILGKQTVTINFGGETLVQKFKVVNKNFDK